MSEITVRGHTEDGFEQILSGPALSFLTALNAEFCPRIFALMAERRARQAAIDAGELPDFLDSTRDIREADWRVRKVPGDLEDRRVEITGPTDRKMIINALNSGARVFMADCEDSLSPTWDNVIRGQINLRDAVRRTISLETDGKEYRLADNVATLVVRPRGLHLPEKHLEQDGVPLPAALVDFGLYLFHNAAALKAGGTGPYFYLPKLESHLEARLWADIFRFAEQAGVVEPGEICATVLVETILAAFEIDEILYELRDFAVGMNCGRWDYIFSIIKKFHRFPEFIMPDRNDVTMTSHFLRSYSRLVVDTCHRRGAHAIGGMSAHIPVRSNAEANERAFASVRADKEREVRDGHDGTWVAHPALVPLATEIFDREMPAPNQVNRPPVEIDVQAGDLLHVMRGRITEAGMRNNISVAVQYMAAWLDGNGCVPINHLMEDAATAEIARAQLWQWVHLPTGILDEGRNVTIEMFRALLDEELDAIREAVGVERFTQGKYVTAAEFLDRITAGDEFLPFITTELYDLLP
jgi:malate synthase